MVHMYMHEACMLFDHSLFAELLKLALTSHAYPWLGGENSVL